VSKTLVIRSEFLGSGSDELGERLMGSFLRKLWAEDTKPDTIIFYNSGVKLVAEKSTVLDALTELHAAGVDLVACGTCASYFEIKDRIKIGRVSDMREIVSLLMSSESVVTL
jgi:selenium metabolism protein YedF